VAVTSCITLAADGNGGWAVSVDGVPQAPDFPLRWVDQAEMPFAGVYLGGERQFDVVEQTGDCTASVGLLVGAK
jgi:hypothetical protein